MGKPYQRDTVAASTRVKRATYSLVEQWAKEMDTSVSDIVGQCVEQGVLRRQLYLRNREAPENQLQGLPPLLQTCGD